MSRLDVASLFTAHLMVGRTDQTPHVAVLIEDLIGELASPTVPTPKRKKNLITQSMELFLSFHFIDVLQHVIRPRPPSAGISWSYTIRKAATLFLPAPRLPSSHRLQRRDRPAPLSACHPIPAR